MLAARDRAAGSASRAALLRNDAADGETPAIVAVTPSAVPGRPTAAPRRAALPHPPGSPVATPAPERAVAPKPAAPTAAPAPPADDGDTLTRLRDAKRRARER